MLTNVFLHLPAPVVAAAAGGLTAAHRERIGAALWWSIVFSAGVSVGCRLGRWSARKGKGKDGAWGAEP